MRHHFLSTLFKRLFLLLTISTPFFLVAQKPADFGIKSKKAMELYLEGRQQAQYRDYNKAKSLYLEAVKLEPDFADANFALGEAACALRKFEDAYAYMDKANSSARKDNFPTLPFFLGKSAFYLGKYAEAETHLAAFIKNPKGLKVYLDEANALYPKSKFAAEGVKNPVKFAPINLGENINSDGEEYLPFLTADDRTLLFTSKRPESTGGFNSQYREYPEDVYISEYNNRVWDTAFNVGPPINTDGYEGAASITQDGKVVFFAAETLSGYGGYDLFFAIKTAKGWGTPKNLGPNINTEAWESQPFLSPDGKTLYFSSKRKGGFGQEDIWYSTWENGQWTPAKNIGKPLNTPGSEQCPFIHADGRTMYFSSDFHPGFGMQDIFVTYLSADSGWSTPKNMGYPLNTTAHEGNIFVNTKGTRGFINSNREGGFGGNDLYEFMLDEGYRPQISTFLRGVSRDSITQAPIPARIKLVDIQTGDTVRMVYSNKNDGKFLMSLPMNREYAAFAEAQGYMFAGRHFYLKDLPEDIYFDIFIDLPPIRKNQEIVLHNIFFSTGSFLLQPASFVELDLLVTYLQKNPKMKIEVQGHTDNVGSDESNLNLSQNRANAVREYLVSKGIQGERVAAMGYGENQPITTNDTEEGRAQNRRTAFKITDI